MKYFLTLFTLISVMTHLVGQQGFKGTAIVGVNLAQIDGDGLAGYNKPGISVGLQLSYPIKPMMDLSMELLYSTRGSQEKLFGDVSGGGLGTTNLKYIELPLIFSIKDWYIEGEKYHKVKAEAGISLGYLFDVESNNTTYNNDIGNLKEQDLSYVLGVSYNINSHLGITFRYTRSLIDLYKLDGRLLSYFLTFRTGYTF